MVGTDNLQRPSTDMSKIIVAMGIGLFSLLILNIFDLLSFWTLVAVLGGVIMVLKFGAPSVGTVLVLVVIIFIILLIPESWISSRQEICFEDGGSLVEDKFGSPWICGTVIYKNIDITTQNPDWGFYIWGIEKGESVNITFTLEDGIQKCVIPFSIGYSSVGYPGTKVSFGITDDNSIMYETRHEDLVYVFINSERLRTETGEIPTVYFVTTGQKWNATLKIETGRSCSQDWIGLKKVDF